MQDWFNRLLDHPKADMVLVVTFIVCSVGFIAWAIWAALTTNLGEDVQTEESGDYDIVEVGTHGEMHEYLDYHVGFRGSLCHLPNCKYCKRHNLQK